MQYVIHTAGFVDDVMILPYGQAKATATGRIYILKVIHQVQHRGRSLTFTIALLQFATQDNRRELADVALGE